MALERRYLPVHFRSTPCGFPIALSSIDSMPVTVSALAGVHVKAILQCDLAISVAGQSSVTPKILVAAAGLSISTDMPGCFRLPLGFLIVTNFGLLVVPTLTLPKFSLCGPTDSLTGTGVGVTVGVGVPVAVAVAVGVAVRDAVEVAVAVCVAVAVGVPVRVAVGVEVAVAVPVEVAVGVEVAVAVAVRVEVAVGVAVAVAVVVVVGVAVGVGVGVAAVLKLNAPRP